DDVEPERDDGDGEQLLAQHRPDDDPLEDHADDRGQRQGGQHRQRPPQPQRRAGHPPARHLQDGGERGDEERPQGGQGAVGEVEDLGRLEDDHEAHRQQRIDRPQRQEVDQQPTGGRGPRLGETERLDHDESISLIRSENICSMAFRLTFWVAVSSPSSWSSSLGSKRNFRMFSTRANFLFVSSTTFWMSSITSGFSDRSRYVVYGIPCRVAQSPTVSNSI